MNELQIIRAQLETEDRHFRAVAEACAEVLEMPSEHAAFLQACGDYLSFATGRLQAFADAQAPDVQLTEALHAMQGTLPAPASCRHFIDIFTARVGQRRAALSAAGARDPSITAWREWSRIDADCILLERRHYQRVKQTKPAGLRTELP
jgi:hypothetical protein